MAIVAGVVRVSIEGEFGQVLPALIRVAESVHKKEPTLAASLASGHRP
jgi:hypothetical protein